LDGVSEEELTLMDDEQEGSDAAETEENDHLISKTSTGGKKQPREKIGVATFAKDDDGIRRMKLIVEMGKEFHWSDVVIQLFVNE
jgi:hypothetical protein